MFQPEELPQFLTKRENYAIYNKMHALIQEETKNIYHDLKSSIKQISRFNNMVKKLFDIIELRVLIMIYNDQYNNSVAMETAKIYIACIIMVTQYN